MRQLVYYIFLLVHFYYLILIISCKGKSADEAPTVMRADTTLPYDFIDFYKKFHRDSAYQLSHIVFPLTGVMQDTAGQDSLVNWTSENWKIHLPIVPDDMWAVDFSIPFEGVIVEFVHARQGGFWMERRFARMDTTWRLIYYEGLRMGRE